MKAKSLRPYAKIPTPLLCDKSLQGADIRVYGVIASHGDIKNGGKVWPGQGTIAHHLGVDKSNVKRSVKRLLAAGYIIKISTGGGRTYSNQYRVMVDFSKEGLYTPLNTPQDDQKNLPIKGGPCDNKRGVHVTPKDNRKISYPPYLPSEREDTVGPDGPSQEIIGASDEAIKDGPDGPAQSVGAPDPSFDEDLVSKVKKELSSGGAKPKNFDPNKQLEATSRQWARDRLLKHFGVKNGATEILMAADDPDHPDHEKAVEACQEAAKQLRIHYSRPKRKTA